MLIWRTHSGGKQVAEAGSANLGLRDVQMGLEWVQENIWAFAGDPGQVSRKALTSVTRGSRLTPGSFRSRHLGNRPVPFSYPCCTYNLISTCSSLRLVIYVEALSARLAHITLRSWNRAPNP